MDDEDEDYNFPIIRFYDFYDDGKYCPVCREGIDLFDLSPDMEINTLVDKLKFKCEQINCQV